MSIPFVAFQLEMRTNRNNKVLHRIGQIVRLPIRRIHNRIKAQQLIHKPRATALSFQLVRRLAQTECKIENKMQTMQ